MTNNKKAILQLESCGVTAKEENGTVYVCVDDLELELAEFEINYRAERYDEENA